MVSQRENIWDHGVKYGNLLTSLIINSVVFHMFVWILLSFLLSFYPGPDEMLFLNN